MFAQIAHRLTENIDDITRQWVDELRRSERTETHKQLLSSEIVNGVKGMLANLAAAIESREAPDRETIPMDLISGTLGGGPERNGGQGLNWPELGEAQEPAKNNLLTTKPLSGPLSRAQQSAAAHGKLRHTQGFELQELILEYVKLRQVLWSTLRLDIKTCSEAFGLEFVSYLDRLVDELMLTSIEAFYDTSVRDLESRAIRDPLTQLYNKDFFAQRLNQEMRRAVRHSEPLTVAMIDMDLLKTINDTYGHPVGDAVISAVAAVIRDTSRQSDVPCRYGGDEFAVILPETTKLQGCAFGERLMRAVQNLTIVVAVGSQEYGADLSATGNPNGEDQAKSAMPLLAPVPSLSIGLASFPEDARNPEMLLAKADAALYRAKRDGRNRIAC